MNSLERIRTFVQVVEANNFAAVSQKLNLSKAAVSKQVAALEKEVGIKLLDRTTRRLNLTQEGTLYYTQCKRLLEVVDEMDELVFHMRKQPSGTLKLFCARYFGEYVVLPLLKEFMAMYPSVKVNLWLEERMPDLVKEEVDLLIGVSMIGPLDAIRRSFSQTRYLFCASPEYLEKHGVPQKPIDLIQHRYITHSMRKPDNVLEFENLQLTIDPYLRVNDAWAMLKCAQNGLGIVKLHDYMVKDSLKTGSLVEILKDYSKEIVPISLYYMSNRYLNPKIRCFVDFLLNKLNDTG